MIFEEETSPLSSTFYSPPFYYPVTRGTAPVTLYRAYFPVGDKPQRSRSPELVPCFFLTNPEDII